MKENTMAHDLADRRGNDGQNFDPDIPQDLVATTVYAGETVRYEFADGSAIIESMACWDLGVHADRLMDDLYQASDDPADMYRPDAYAMVGALQDGEVLAYAPVRVCDECRAAVCEAECEGVALEWGDPAHTWCRAALKHSVVLPVMMLADQDMRRQLRTLGITDADMADMVKTRLGSE